MNRLRLTDAEYHDRAEAVLTAVEACCDHLNDTTDTDIDNQRAGSMITLTFENDSQIVINLQPPLHEIWLAARAGGFHYQWDAAAAQWLCSRSGSDFFADLSRYASEQAECSLRFQADAQNNT